MTRTRGLSLAIAILALAALACNLPTGQAAGTPEPSTVPTQPVPTSEPLITPTAPAAETPAAQDSCLAASAAGETAYVNEAGGYCFILPDGFNVTEENGLDIFVVGPTLETFGQEGLVLAFGFSVIGAPGGAGAFDAASWGDQVAADNSAASFDDISIEPYTFSGAELDGVRVGPLPGMVGGEAAYVRANDTLYGVTVYPHRESFPDYVDQVDALWAQLSASIRFFTPVDTGVDYPTPEEVCPTEQPGTRLVTRYSEGWCVLIPENWQEDTEFGFPGRFLGGPEIGEFWPGQPAYANIVVGYNGPARDVTLDQQAEGRSTSNGRPDLVQRTDTVIGGYPAIILNTQDGPIPDRVAFIHANGNMYSVLGQPFDPENYAAAQPDLEAAWELMIGSIQFFEAYR